MNKLASIFYIMEQGFPTLDVTILPRINPERILTQVYRDLPNGWVVRCGEEPSYHASPEKPLPWAVAYEFDDLRIKVREITRDVGSNYLVFIHPQRRMDRAGNLLITPTNVIIEGCYGPYMNLARLAAGRDNPQQSLYFKPGMLGVRKLEGTKVFTIEDLLQLRQVERNLITNPNAPTSIEFSFDGTRIDIHDIN